MKYDFTKYNYRHYNRKKIIVLVGDCAMFVLQQIIKKTGKVSVLNCGDFLSVFFPPFTQYENKLKVVKMLHI